MGDTSLGSSSNKRQRKDITTAKKKNAFDIMLNSSKLCWPSGDAPTHMPILQMVAENGWFPWHMDEISGQNPDYSNLRLVSKDMKKHMDNPANGGPDFKEIVLFLDCKNGFDDDEGFCDHCFSSREGEDACDTCEDIGGCNYDSCNCKKSHRYGPVLTKLDPRLNPDVKFQSLPRRTRAKLLLRFLRTVASNFLAEYHDEWGKVKINLFNMLQYSGWDLDKLDKPVLTMIDPRMLGGDMFNEQMREYNLPFYNFIHHLLFTGWADNDCYTSPGSCSPFRGRLIGDGKHYNAWNGGHREFFGDMWECFMCLHKSEEEKTIPPQTRYPSYSLSQIQYLPETIRRIVANCVDKDAEDLLGKSISDSIDIYRIIRETYRDWEDVLKVIKWMPCLGVSEEDFVPMLNFEGYNPLHERYGEVVDNIDRTGLQWG